MARLRHGIFRRTCICPRYTEIPRCHSLSEDINVNPMDTTSPPSAPPAYVEEAENLQWRIRNARYRSVFTTEGEPGIEDYRDHAERMVDSFLDCSPNIGNPADLLNEPRFIDVQYSQALSNIDRLLYSYQEILPEIAPLREEDVLFLLLERYAKSSGAGVYIEIRRPGDVQVFDSSIPEPPHTNRIDSHLTHAAGIVNAEFSVSSQLATDPPHYIPIPQTPTDNNLESSVTLNFPEMLLLSRDNENNPARDSSPPYVNTNRIDTYIEGWGSEKLQPPDFQLHRCHHHGIEECVPGEEFLLPLGFPEIIHHMHDLPYDVYHIGFYVENPSGSSIPYTEGGVQAFECHILPNDIPVYITVERQGDRLAYNCFRDMPVWAVAHDHESCTCA